ncbi:ATP-grasp domain-containing protein [Streptomyces sp. NBC_00683]|uniref:ATP-grasp domain-containing protein n=1 Tax=Streptomyces sp. NBC_00683 TaxID=2903670 RepID=UPI002E31283A|nr:ATP-grasp domain-containing protein [Streptomyces sp. NBC_00683]
MTARLVLVGAAPMAEGYLTAARQLGMEIGLVEAPERARALRSRFDDVIIDTEQVDPGAAGRDDGWMKPTAALTERLRPDGVLASSEIHVLAASLVQEQYRLPGPGLDAAAISRDKSQQRFRFAGAGLDQPAHLKVRHLSEAGDWASAHFPVVVKPLNRAGSDGVERIDGADRWADAVTRRESEGTLLVEEYVEGQEYSWEGLVQDGRVVFGSLTFKETTGAPYFVELAHLTGHERTDPVLGRAADALGQAVARAVRMGSGVMFVEFRTRGDRLVIMEVAVRAPGDHCMDAISLGYGFDVFAEILKLSTGADPDLAHGRSLERFTGSGFVVADRDGTLESAREPEWSGWPGVARHGVDAGPGDPVGPPRSSADRIAWALVDCAEAPQRRALLDRIRAVRPSLSPVVPLDLLDPLDRR